MRTRSATGKPTAPYRLVTAPIDGPGHRVEVREYRCRTPLDEIYETIDHHLEFTLSPQGWSGGYPRVSDELRPIGQVMLVPAGERFRAANRAGVKRALVCAFAGSKLAAFADLPWTPADLARSTDIRSPRLEALLSALMEEAFAPGVASEVLVDAAIVSIMVELRRYFGSEPEEPAAGRLAPWQLRMIREQVDDGSGPVRTVAQLAAECGVSSRQLMRAFKATTGLTLGGYIKSARLSLAKRLLSRPELMIKQAAFECGFETAAAFAAAFRKATGMTPNEYRKLVRAGS